MLCVIRAKRETDSEIRLGSNTTLMEGCSHWTYRSALHIEKGDFFFQIVCFCLVTLFVFWLSIVFNFSQFWVDLLLNRLDLATGFESSRDPSTRLQFSIINNMLKPNARTLFVFINGQWISRAKFAHRCTTKVLPLFNNAWWYGVARIIIGDV